MARIDDYKESFRLAALELRGKDVAVMAEAAGVELVRHEEGAELRVVYLGVPYRASVTPGADISIQDSPEEVPLPDKILIAHYLLGATGKKPTGKLITFRQIPDGKFYFDAFQRRARDPFVAFFGAKGRLFRKCAESMGAEPVRNGDHGMEFRVFPQISVQLILWEGDDEFPPDATILFDENIQGRLPAEDIAVLSGTLVYRLIALARKMESEV